MRQVHLDRRVPYGAKQHALVHGEGPNGAARAE